MLAIRQLRNVSPSMAELALLRGLWRRHPIYRGCVGHWLMNEAGGSRAHDISGNSNHGTLTGPTTLPLWSTGKWGAAVSFDGTEDYITAGSPSILQITGAFTYSLWMNTTSSIGGRIALSRRTGDSASTIAANIEFEGTGGTAANFYVSSGTTLQGSGVSANGLNDGIWHHIVGVYVPSTSITIYRDGVQANQNTSSIIASVTATSMPIIIGARGGTATYFFPGMIDNIQIYNRALSASEINTLYHNPFVAFRWASEQRRVYYSTAVAGQGSNASFAHYYYRMSGS